MLATVWKWAEYLNSTMNFGTTWISIVCVHFFHCFYRRKNDWLIDWRNYSSFTNNRLPCRVTLLATTLDLRHVYKLNTHLSKKTDAGETIAGVDCLGHVPIQLCVVADDLNLAKHVNNSLNIYHIEYSLILSVFWTILYMWTTTGTCRSWFAVT